jgi:hypothetical protein
MHHDRMLKLFLVAKAWQIFLLLVGCMFASAVFMSTSPDPFVGMLIGTLIFMGVWMAWLWTIAQASNQKVDPVLRKSTRMIAVSIAYAALYVLVSPLIWPDLEGRPGVPALMVPMHLLAMVAIFYVLLFTANRLVTLDRKQKVSFFDYSGPFVLLWFFPLGVWFIQPRVNKLLASDDA